MAPRSPLPDRWVDGTAATMVADVISFDVLVIGAAEGRLRALSEELRQWALSPSVTRIVADDEAMPALANEEPWDLIVLTDVDLGRSLASVVADFDAGEDAPPVIIICGRERTDEGIAAMRDGARDFIHWDQLERLGPVAKRELEDREVRRVRRNAENALVASEHRYRAVLDDQTEFVVSAFSLLASFMPGLGALAGGVLVYAAAVARQRPAQWFQRGWIRTGHGRAARDRGAPRQP